LFVLSLMGTCCNKDSGVRAEPEPTITMIILGTSQAGKSTFFKQLKIMHGPAFSSNEKDNMKKLIGYNFVVGLHELLDVAEKSNVSLEALEFEKKLFLNANERDDRPLDQKTILAAKTIWNRKEIVELRKVPYVRTLAGEGNLEYFMQNIDRIGQEDYEPTLDDIVRCRQRTVGVGSIAFKYRGEHIKVIDVGGQEAERRKWSMVSPKASTIIFLGALTHFDLPAQFAEDSGRTQLDESLDVWEELIRTENFQDSGIILFLNKKDLFDEQIEGSGKNFKKVFPDYEGEATADGCAKFIRNLYVQRAKTANENLHVTTHFTTAVDPTIMQKVFADVMLKLLQATIKDIGM